MNKKIIVAISVIVTMLAAAGWYVWHRHKTAAPSPAQPAPTEQTVQAQTDFYQITAKYPVEPWDKDGVMAQFVNQQVEQHKEAWKTGGDIYNSEQKVEQQFPDRPKMVYTLDITYQKNQSEKIGTVSYVFTLGEYTGGANGNETVQTFTFNQNGQVNIESILNLAGSVTDSSGKTVYNDLALSKLLLKQTAADPQMFPDQGLASDGLGLSYLKADGLTLDHAKCHCDGYFYGSNLQNFAVTDQGLTFYFSKYAITIGAAGIADISLPWDSLEPYLVSQTVGMTDN